MKTIRLIFITLAFIAAGIAGSLLAAHMLTTEPAPATTIEILIGTLCNAGPEVVTNSWSDPALEGCKEIRVHTVALTDV